MKNLKTLFTVVCLTILCLPAKAQLENDTTFESDNIWRDGHKTVKFMPTVLMRLGYTDMFATHINLLPFAYQFRVSKNVDWRVNPYFELVLSGVDGSGTREFRGFGHYGLEVARIRWYNDEHDIGLRGHGRYNAWLFGLTYLDRFEDVIATLAREVGVDLEINKNTTAGISAFMGANFIYTFNQQMRFESDELPFISGNFGATVVVGFRFSVGKSIRKNRITDFQKF